tara:strand:- start:389 stop:604 length:216 start_codon:yes stop_codon:yes gene_type:complete
MPSPSLRLGDLVCLCEPLPVRWRDKHHGAGIVTNIQTFTDQTKYPQITIKWLKSGESFRFLEHDVKVLHEA